MRDEFDTMVADRVKVLIDVPVPDIWSRVEAKLFDPTPSQFDDEVAVVVELDEPRRTRVHHDRRRWTGVIVGTAAAAAALVGGIVVLTQDDSKPTTGAPDGTDVVVEGPLAAFVDTWHATDADGNALTLEIARADDATARITQNASAGVLCGGATSTLTGSGRLNGPSALVVTVSGVTCDDGSDPASTADQLGPFNLLYRAGSDTLLATSGVVWRRDGPRYVPPPSDTMWPQSTLDEVAAAQALADAGDPEYAWQVDGRLTTDNGQQSIASGDVEILNRFLREKLGWNDYVFSPDQGHNTVGAADRVWSGITFLRCESGQANPLYSTPPGEAPGAERCAPTIDDLHYERVELELAQLGRRTLDGIWVVNSWTMREPFAQADPIVAEDDARAVLAEFLGARIAGEGADDDVTVASSDWAPVGEIPLLYATSAGARFERFEIERVGGPWWPTADMEFSVQLFADGGDTVVEQQVAWTTDNAADYDIVLIPTSTTENGVPVPVRYAFFGGEVTVAAPLPWELEGFSDAMLAVGGDGSSERIELITDPIAPDRGCAGGVAPADARQLAAIIHAKSDFDSTEPEAVNVGGQAGVVIDVTAATGAPQCGPIPTLRLDDGERMRLYVIDMPEGSSTRVVGIAIIATDEQFDEAVAAAAPIIASIEFDADGAG